MRKKITLGYCCDLAKKKNGKCLSTEYEHSHAKMFWECEQGHRWQASVNTIQHGHWCLDCSGLRKKDLKWCCELAREKGGKCLSTGYKNNREAMLWQCSEEHQWWACVGSIKQGTWCPFCAGTNKKDLQWCCDLAKKKNGKCLSTEYKNALTDMLWECEYGHQWEAKANTINNGHWCSLCAGNKKKNLEWCCSMAKKKNGKCLSTEYEHSNAKMFWECALGHQWSTTAHMIQSGHWCSTCGWQKKNLGWCCELAEKRGGKCLSTDYKNNCTNMLWQCSEEHRWNASASNIQRGSWCPECKNKTQRKLKQIIMEIFNLTEKQVAFNFTGFDWLKTIKNNKQEIDIWLPEKKLAIEYDGEQHFGPVNFGGIGAEKAQANFIKTQFLDIIKNEKISAHPEDVQYFVRFSYKEPITIEHVREKLIKEGIK